jgi:deoxyribose-phosphate aldolase
MDIARFVDHTLLKPDATPEQIQKLCAEAREYGFASVCVNPSYVPQAAKALEGSTSVVCTVIGFPLGATSTESKVFETQAAIAQGAREVDMVIQIGWLKAGNREAVLTDIRAVVEAAHANGGLCKVIIETALLSDDEKIAATELVVQAGADFVKTSTGFSTGGATVGDVALLRRAAGPTIGVKAAGGIRSLADAQAMITAGATRLGTSAGVQLVREARGEAATPKSGTSY